MRSIPKGPPSRPKLAHLDGKKATRIALKANEDPTDSDAWLRQHEWMLMQMARFKRTFAPRLKAIQVTNGTLLGGAGPVQTSSMMSDRELGRRFHTVLTPPGHARASRAAP
jgi:hypothetical protein